MTETKAKALGPAPAHDRPIGEVREYLAAAYGLPDGYGVERVVRYGGRQGTALTVHVRAPGGVKPLVIRYDEERMCRDAGLLRAVAAASTDGLTRGDLITTKSAPSVYEALCALSDAYERMDVKGQTWEWVQELLARGAGVTGCTLNPAQPESRFLALAKLKRFSYSKSTVEHPGYTKDGKPIPSVPPLLVDSEDDSRWVTARHLCVFVRFDLGVDVKEDAVFSRILELPGGKRQQVEQWSPDRSQKHRLVLYRLPDPAAEDPE